MNEYICWTPDYEPARIEASGIEPAARAYMLSLVGDEMIDNTKTIMVADEDTNTIELFNVNLTITSKAVLPQ